MTRTRITAFIVAAVAALALMLPATAFAESFTGSSWNVTYTSGGTMSDDYSTQTYADQISGLQPGDDITFTINLKHSNSKDADWYMANEVIKSLETSKAKGSAYGYKLSYSGPGQSRTLYDSDTVGGDNTSADGEDGLLEATSAMEDFFFLDNLENGESGKITLVVTLDGETEQNAYFDTLAQLKMKFGVDPESTKTRGTTSTTTSRTAVTTGDDTNLFPFYVAMAVSGILLLVLAIYSLRSRRREREDS